MQCPTCGARVKKEKILKRDAAAATCERILKKIRKMSREELIEMLEQTLREEP